MTKNYILMTTFSVDLQYQISLKSVK